MAPSAAMPAAGGGAALLERLSVSLPLERGARGAVDMRRGTGKDGGRTGGGPIWDQPDGSDHTGTLGALFSGVRLGADRAFGRVSLPNDDPLTLWAAGRLLPSAKGLAFGVLTFGLFLGALPTHLDWEPIRPGPEVYAATALLSLPLLCYGLCTAQKRR